MKTSSQTTIIVTATTTTTEKEHDKTTTSKPILERTSLLLPNNKNRSSLCRYLYLPTMTNVNNSNNNNINNNNNNVSSISTTLPTNMDEYLGTISSIVQSNKNIIQKGHYTVVHSSTDDDEYCCIIGKEENKKYHTTSSTDNSRKTLKGKILNICQREKGHTTSSQNDIIVSDDATTCHILALYSYTSSSSLPISSVSAPPPLSSMAHIDKPEYESCIRRMVQTHKEYHNNNHNNTTTTTNKNSKIHMYIHLVGGFNDDDGSSRDMTTYLLLLFAKIASEEKSSIRMLLQTCLVSCLNHNNDYGKNGDPIFGRGLAMHTSTGHVFLINSIHSSATGPEIPLRSCRIYALESDTCSHSTLSLIHTYNNLSENENNKSIISITPILFDSNDADLDFLAQLPDELLLKFCSTSPKFEKDDFCIKFRGTCQYIRSHTCYDIFGHNCNEILKFCRVWNNDFGFYTWVKL